jgi:Tfp pilus assembly protein PilN
MTTCEAIAVDLLPPDEARTAAARRRARRLGGLGVAIAALGLALGHGALEVAGGVTEQEIVQADAERAALERPVAALRRLQQRQVALRSRLAVLERLEARGGALGGEAGGGSGGGSGGGLVGALGALAAAAPPQLWLTELKLTGDRLELAGLAADEQTIADFVARLRGVKPLEALDLEDAARDDHATPASRRFVIAGHVGDRR